MDDMKIKIKNIVKEVNPYLIEVNDTDEPVEIDGFIGESEPIVETENVKDQKEEQQDFDQQEQDLDDLEEQDLEEQDLDDQDLDQQEQQDKQLVRKGNQRDTIVKPIVLKVLTMEEMTKRLFFIETAYKKLRREFQAIRCNRHEPARNITRETLEIEDEKLISALSRNDINADLAIIREYYLDSEPQPIKKKATRNYEYFDNKWKLDNGTSIMSILIYNLRTSYLAFNNIKHFSSEQMFENQKYMAFMEKDAKYRKDLLNLINGELYL